MKKDTIYIDVDDEITAIIDKLQASQAKIVALVLPKRAAALQSIVNMKLLKSAASQVDKQAVLITTEAGLLPLAGATGMYVAKNLQSKPEIPEASTAPYNNEEEVIAQIDEDNEVDPTKSVGELSGDEAEPSSPSSSSATPDSSKKKSPKNKPKVPNFERFRKKLLIGVGILLILVIGWYVMAFVLPRASIAIETDTTNVDTSLQFTASPNTDEIDEENQTIPATIAEGQESDQQTASATGERDESERASGTVTFSKPCSPETPPTIPSGTGVSTSNLTFVTQSSTTLSPTVDNGCQFTGSAEVQAQNTGDEYNIGPSSYSVSGHPDVEGQGSAMTGGVSRVVTVVSESDVNNARNDLDISEEDEKKAELVDQIHDEGLFAIEDTFNIDDEQTDVNPAVGQEADNVAVEYSAQFSMVGVNQQDLERLVEMSIEDDIDIERQAIQDFGFDDAEFQIVEVAQDGSRVISLDTSLVVGPEINEEELKDEISRKRSGESENIIRELPGVRDVRVELSPFWVSRVPSNHDKIDIDFDTVE